MLVQGIAVLLLPQFPEKFRQIVGNKPIVICKMPWAELGDFPAGEVAVRTVRKGCIGPQL